MKYLAIIVILFLASTFSFAQSTHRGGAFGVSQDTTESFFESYQIDSLAYADHGVTIQVWNGSNTDTLMIGYTNWNGVVDTVDNIYVGPNSNIVTPPVVWKAFWIRGKASHGTLYHWNAIGGTH